jgi:hypothetical protein
MSETGPISSVFINAEQINKEIKSIHDNLIALNSGLEASNKAFKNTFSEALAVLKEMKGAGSFTELNASAKKMKTTTDELNAANKTQQQQAAEIIRLNERLAALETQQAVAVQKARIEVAQKTREVKAEAQAQIAAEKALQGYDSILKMSTKTINDYTEQNRQLRRVVETLNVNTQGEEIKRLNAVIDTNTAVIKANKDAYVQQKMDVGN